jgi:hypothetical protein
LKALDRLARRERRARVAQALAVIKAAQRAGLPVKGATVEGVPLAFGQPESAPAPQLHPHSTNPWDIIYDETEQKRPS